MTVAIMNTAKWMPELAPLLKRLRLSGILDLLETRNREAVANKIPYFAPSRKRPYQSCEMTLSRLYF